MLPAYNQPPALEQVLIIQGFLAFKVGKTKLRRATKGSKRLIEAESMIMDELVELVVKVKKSRKGSETVGAELGTVLLIGAWWEGQSFLVSTS